MTPEQLFDQAYERLANASRCDTPGGVEYERVRVEWIAAGRPEAVEAFILRSANQSPPTPSEYVTALAARVLAHDSTKTDATDLARASAAMAKRMAELDVAGTADARAIESALVDACEVELEDYQHAPATWAAVTLALDGLRRRDAEIAKLRNELELAANTMSTMIAGWSSLERSGHEILIRRWYELLQLKARGS